MGKVLTPKNIQKQDTPPKQIIPDKYQSLFYCFLLILAIIIFFRGAYFGGGFNTDDNIASASLRPFLEMSKRNGIFPQWIPYVFAGFPNYASMFISGARPWDFIGQFLLGFTVFFGQIFGSDAARVSAFYMIYGLGMYYLMRVKKQERFVAFIVAFGAVFSTYVITWIMIGHNTKPIVLSMFPFVFIALEKLKQRFSILYSILMIIAIHIMVEGSHVQIIFYGVCAVGIYIVYQLIYGIFKRKEFLNILRPAIILAIGLGFGFLMSAGKFLSAMEYTPYSTRGSAAISDKHGSSKQDETGGNEYDYSTMWSYTPGETITFLIPGYFGSGDQEFKGQMQSTYWGEKESEDSPPFMGIAILALAIMGLILYRKDVFVQFLFILCVFSLLLSFGKYLPILYDFFFYHVPTFNKFRAPSMALVLMHFAVPILAGYGLGGAMKWRTKFDEKDKKLLKGFLIGSAVFLVLGLLYSAIFKESYLQAVADKFKTNELPPEFQDFIWGSVMSDWLGGGIILIVLFGLIWMFIQRKVNYAVFYLVVALLVVVDLWRVDVRRMDISKQKLEAEIFAPYQNFYKPIQQDTSVFRIADLVAPHPNLAAYFLLENVNGYHSAKLRIYQDLLDNANGHGFEGNTHTLYNPFLWNLMNVKYILAPENPQSQDRQSRPHIYNNPDALPRAFFVDSAIIAKPIDILSHLHDGNFNPKRVAFIESELPVKIDTLLPDAYVNVSEKQNEYIKLDVNATGNNLLFISEIYYPPGWKAYIDGAETPIYKTDYAFRSVLVPKGKHTIEMKYNSEKFEMGRKLTLYSNIVVTALIVVGGFFEYKKRKNTKKAE